MARADSPNPEPQDGRGFAAPQDPEKLIAWLDRKRDQGKARMPDLQMKLNLAFVLGQQWIVWDKDRNRFQKPRSRANDPNAPVRITANKIGGIVERSIAKLTKSSPIPEARPVSDSEDDVDAARVATRILTHELERVEWDSMLGDFYFWPVTLGWSYLHVRWEPDSGPKIGTVDGAQGAPLDVYEGEIELEPVPAFELGVDPNGRTMHSAMWATRSTSMSKEAVWEKWGKLPDGPETGRTIVDDVYALADADYSNKAYDEFIRVHQFWLRPGSRIAPKGMVVTWAGKTILEGPTDYPYEHGRLPFVQFDLLPGLGPREGRTWVNDLIPLQTDYNDARSREAVIRRLLVPKILAPTGSIDPTRVTSRVEVISYNPTGQPPSIEVPDSGWMAQYEAGMTRADMEMGERAGQQDVSSGRAPSASMPAAAILALQEADDTKLAISAKKLAAGTQEVGWQVLQLVRQFWTEERTVRTWSDDGSLEVKRFSGANVSEQLDVHVSAESALPRSKSARAQLTMELAQAGFITDPRVIVRMLDVPGVDLAISNFDVDTKRATRENGHLLQGEVQQVQSFDNHMIHIEEHDKLRKGIEYEQAPDEIKKVIDDHANAHYALVLQQLSVPTPPGTEQTSENPGLAAMGGGGPEYTDPLTGKPPDPTQVAAGQTPSALTHSRIGGRDGIGGPGQQGRVPGIERDSQAAKTGN